MDTDNKSLLSAELLERYLAGECNVAEQGVVLAWIGANPESELATSLNARRITAPVHPDVSAAWNRFKGARTTTQSRKKPLYWLHAVWVVALVAIGIKYMSVNPTASSPERRRYATAMGQQATITLADGSTMTLAPATTASVNGRNIELSGQAVFAVAHKEGDPFVVNARGTITRVIGTRFGVRAYDNRVAVAVSDGRVSVNSNVLSANDIATVTANGTEVQRDTDVSYALSWTEGRLSFRRSPLQDVLKELGRVYNVDFKIEGERLGNREVTATLSTGDLEDNLKELSLLLDTRYDRTGSTILITQR